MSGGHFNYADGNLKSEMFGWVDKPYDVMEDAEISELVWDLLDLIHIHNNFSLYSSTAQLFYMLKIFSK